MACKYPKGKEDGWRRRDEVLTKLDKRVSLEAARRDAPRETEFAWTGVAEEVKAVANAAFVLSALCVVIGPASIGKTLTLTALLKAFPGSVLITINDGCHSTMTLLRTLTEALRLPSAARQRKGLFDALAAYLRENKRLIMVDETHLASLEMLTTLRQIQDEAKCPMLLAGLPALSKMLMTGRGDDCKGATLYSRVGMIRDLTERCRSNPGEPLFSIDDVRKMFARGSVRLAKDAVDWLQGLACLPEVGGPRACENAVKLAAHIAQQRGEDRIGLDLLLQASQLLLGVDGARQLGNRIKQLAKKVG